MKDVKKIASIATSIMWLPVMVWELLKNRGYITIGSPWIEKNEALIGLVLLSLPSVLILMLIATKPNVMIYDKDFLLSVEVVFTIAYVALFIIYHCSILFSVIGWLALTVPFVINYYKLIKHESLE